MGLAAAVVKPWTWYVVLSSLALPVVWGGLYIVSLTYDWPNRIGVALVAVAMSVFPFAYFYKRRVLFGARPACPDLLVSRTHAECSLSRS